VILFAADQHYGKHPGRNIHECLKDDYEIDFHEDDWTCFAQPFADRYDLLALNLISSTCDIPPPAPECEPNVRAYVESGKPMLLLHGASAAFWQWDWWRPLVGFRWVRGEDPDGFDASSHPVRPYKVKVAKARHPLCSKLHDMFLPEDEIYTCLEETCPTWTIMETTTDEGTFPMCYECITPHGGKVIGFLPGHGKEICQDPQVIDSIRILINYLLES
jgi:hypothetical protein